MALPITHSTVLRRARFLGLVAPLLLALSCSAPPGVGDDEEDESDGLSAYGGPGAGAATGASGLQPAPGGTGGTTSGSANGAGGSAGSEGPGVNPGLSPSPGSAGQSANPAGAAGTAGAAGATATSSDGAVAGASGAGTQGSAGSGAMPPVVPPVVTPPVTPPIVTPPVVTPPAAANANCPGQFFCDDFEGVAASAAPSAALWKIMASYAITTQSANVQVSADNQHGGSQALRVIGAQSRNGVIATLPQTKYFLRAWLQVDAAPRGPVLIGLGSDQNSEVRLRIFNQSWATINAVPGDGVFPDGAKSGNCPGCVTLTPNRWFCAEFSIDDAARSATLWIDEVEAATIVNGQGGWVTQPAAPQMFLGSMGLEGGTAGVWIDDVVAGPARIFCD